SAACGQRSHANSETNLSYAEHRFDSTAKPLGRMLMNFDALVQATVNIIRERNPTSSEHRGANLALEDLTAESMIQLGMVADACEIVVHVNRFLKQ
ncbi:MAG: hypothetical protein ACKPKO_63490, partial [Candidatus Fonsibacter sp.]